MRSIRGRSGKLARRSTSFAEFDHTKVYIIKGSLVRVVDLRLCDVNLGNFSHTLLTSCATFGCISIYSRKKIVQLRVQLGGRLTTLAFQETGYPPSNWEEYSREFKPATSHTSRTGSGRMYTVGTLAKRSLYLKRQTFCATPNWRVLVSS